MSSSLQRLPDRMRGHHLAFVEAVRSKLSVVVGEMRTSALGCEFLTFS